ncbi:hypothetical protein BH09VER1_BH09VER1_08480 [soil metagenome]
MVISLMLPWTARADDSASISRANQTLKLAGYPPLPSEAEQMKCYAWNGQGAGIYAMFLLKEPGDLAAYLASLPSWLAKAEPIPGNLLSPPLAQAAWFTPPSTAKAYVLHGGRIWHAAPEIFRLYVDPEKATIYLYYTWNNKRTYP